MRGDDSQPLSMAASPRYPRFGIAAGARFLPDTRRHLRDWARQVGRQGEEMLPSMIRNGLEHYHVAPGMSLEDLSYASIERLIERSGLRPTDVDLLIFSHTNTTSVMAAPHNLPARLAKRYGMDRALCYSISQQSCASAVCALRVLRTLMWRHASLNNVLLISTDKMFLERMRNVANYAIQSDGSMALWLQRDLPRNRIGHIASHVDAIYYKGVRKGPELGQRFALNYPLLAHRMITEVMTQSGWTGDDVDAVLPMNANLTAFSRVMQMLQLPADKLHSENIGKVGHMFSCDPFLNFLDRFAQPARVASGNAILFASASTGVFTAVGISRSWTGDEQDCPWPRDATAPPHAATHSAATWNAP